MFDSGSSQGRLRACPFWERGARCFVVRLRVLKRLVAICSVFWRIDDSGFKNLQEWYRRNIYAVRIVINRWLYEARPASNMPCQDKGMRSRAARGDRKLGANGCRGASWSEQLDGKELRGALGSAIRNREDPRFVDTVYTVCSSFFTSYSMVCRF